MKKIPLKSSRLREKSKNVLSVQMKHGLSWIVASNLFVRIVSSDGLETTVKTHAHVVEIKSLCNKNELI